MKKNLNFLLASFIIVITTFTIICCSQQENPTGNNTNSMLQKSSFTTDNMKKQFVEIMASDEYNNLENNIITIVKGLNNLENVPLDNREKFASWLRINIAKTSFNSEESALELYDKFIAFSAEYMNKNSAFYDELANFEAKDIRSILEPQLLTPPLTTLASPCQNSCMNTCSGNIDALNEGYTENNGWATPRGRLEYWRSYQKIVDIYNGCMSGC